MWQYSSDQIYIYNILHEVIIIFCIPSCCFLHYNVRLITATNIEIMYMIVLISWDAVYFTNVNTKLE